MKFVYEADFGWNKKPLITGNKEIWSSVSIVAKSFDEALSKAKKECDKYVKQGLKGLSLVSLIRKIEVDIG